MATEPSAPVAQDAAPIATESSSSTNGDDAKTRARAQQAAQLAALFHDLGVETGDVIIFDRKCASMNLYGAAICATAKFFGRTQWDHNGVVIRDPSTEELLFLEASLTGVKMRPLVERVLRSQSHEVAVRKLQVHRSREFQLRAFDFATQILNAPYEDRPQRMFNAGVQVPQRREREGLFHALIAQKKQLQRLESELEHRLHMPEFERNALVAQRDAVHERYHRLVEELSQTERSVFENELLHEPTQKRKMFCSQLAAALYQHLGLLLPYPSANSYLPKHFSSGDASQYLKLNQDATLLPEISLRKHLVQSAERHRRLAEEAQSRAPRGAHEIAPIVACLRRHPIFHTLSESELNALAKKFRRRELDAGEVVFYQGSHGEFFYILQDGECDVFVDYNYLRETQTVEEETLAEGTTSFSKTATLRRRKTLALPDFSSSSRLIDKYQRVLVATNGPGSAFGDSALIYETPRRATIQAKTPVVVWQLPKPAFKKVVEQNPGTQCSLEEYLFLMQTLAEHPLFAELDDRAKALAVRKCFPLTFRAGTTILKQGDSGDYFYVVESGKCEILRQKPQLSAPVVDRRIGQGASFGEAALLYNSRRGASVVAVEDTKVWCMDRATFLTITRSGSSALFKLFQQVSSVQTKSASANDESYITQRDLQRMLRAPRRKDLKDVSSSEPPPSRQALDRARRLAHSLLFHDASGLVNFSQFAHFHIALGASNVEQLLPEAAFRILNEQAEEATGTTLGTGAGGDQSAIRLSDLARLMKRWREIDFTYGTSVVRPVDEREAVAVDTLFRRLLGIENEAAGDHRVNCDDLARAITNLSEEDASSDASVAAVEAFVSTLKTDLDVLRKLWQAAELRAGAGAGDLNQGKSALTFDANLRSGWISAIRHIPTASDVPTPPPAAPDSSHDHFEHRKQQLIAHTTSIVAAIAAGGLARTATAPLERLKILMQVGVPSGTLGTPSPYASMARGLVNMARLNGARSLFSGNLAHCLWLVPSLPTKFLLCDTYRNQLAQMKVFDPPSSRQRRSAAHLTNLVAGGLAGVTVNCLLYPLDVVRGRLSVQQYYRTTSPPYRGIRDAFAKIYRQESARALYRGFTPASFGVFSYIGCNYAIYEYLRPTFILYDTETSGHQLGHPSIPGQMLCGVIASVASQTIAYPFDLLRRRMQMGGEWHPEVQFPSYKSTWDCMKQTLREGDVSSRRWVPFTRLAPLYRGLLVNSVKAMPSAVISFIAYEKIRELNADGEE